MAYNYNNNYSNKQNNYKSNDYQEIKPINIPLSEEYRDETKIYLTDGMAYNYANTFSSIPSSQLRKILDVCKQCSRMKTEDFVQARNKMFALVPLAAYNAGRDNKLRSLYNFIKAHINENTLKNTADIIAFDKLFTSIIAYHKYLGKN